ncbi:cytosine permease [Natrialba sp. PRR66]|uniref:cytosine permease n=1 Tax=Natrialba sp. PRR66 TaxID=3098146 RepID=UPI002B1E28A8|nr:cytosine permease [Natrialba sp. PRR66]
MSHEANPEGLEPIPSDQRSMSLFHYILVWWASFIIVQGFSTAFFAVYPQGPLNVVQAAVAMTIGATVSAVLFVINGLGGYREGIPFVTQVRAAFGPRGAMIPKFVCAVPAIIWLGIGNWIGALAIQSITMTLFGFGNVQLYFVLFILLNLALAWGGITSIKWFDSAAAVIIIALLAYTIFKVTTEQGISTASIEHEGTWGLPFLTIVAAHVGTAITAALNANDLSRHLEQRRGSWNHILGHVLGVAPAMLYMALVGIVFGTAITTDTGNPVFAIMDVSPNPTLGAALLMFVLAAQTSSNLTLNMLPAVHIFQDTLDTTWEKGLILTSVLSVVTFPWVLFSSQGGIYFLVINVYSVPLGAVFGVLLAEYWVFRSDGSNTALYDTERTSEQGFMKGFSVTAVLSVLIGSVASLAVLDLSWMVGFPIGFGTYVCLRKLNVDSRTMAYLSDTESQSTAAD